MLVLFAAPAERIYAPIADLPRMDEWSPEYTAVTCTGSFTAPAVGATFIGSPAAVRQAEPFAAPGQSMSADGRPTRMHPQR